MTTLHFTGTRRRPFTVAVNGRLYAVIPGKPLTVTPEDAAALIERDPHLWTEDKPRKVKD